MTSSPLNFTVAICTYNGEHRLPSVLDRLCLCAKETPDSLTWEILVIDNASTDNTPQVVDDYQNKLPIRQVCETQRGLAFARHRAILEAKGEFVGFLDDDNLPETDWVTRSIEFGRENPKMGAYGSRILPEYATPPPENFHRIAPFLAIVDRGLQPRFYPPEKKLLPPGAGLVVRRAAWLNCVPDRLVLIGRTTHKSIAGEDLEALLHLQQAKWEIWYNPAMRVRHLIPASRLEPEYLLNLMEGIGLSRYRTRMLSFPIWLRPFALVAYSFNDLRKILRHLIKYRRVLESDLVAQCEMRLYRSSLFSPLFFWRETLFQKSHRKSQP
ncbi:MAG: hormogonium polysaccharide biosynthesis glycosyltransferase HpsE [Cyanobacteria bacterium SID2]|nr:hormogonium polysaccharide biosynthesis glycosyltransferase HpsE [Cyanobacteria bacterium SID2]MBP0005134.1 hormogonium polysaccharide biosynthesis glycosyltransferase HpsE [Cyanobacteria bacterium SBC]